MDRGGGLVDATCIGKGREGGHELQGRRRRESEMGNRTGWHATGGGQEAAVGGPRMTKAGDA
jgi:hypothetical protein